MNAADKENCGVSRVKKEKTDKNAGGSLGRISSKPRILKAIREYAERSPLRLHMPGHKGRGRARGLFPEPLDVTELDIIDNGRVVAAAEEDVKNILGVKHCRFLTDGASSGIMAALYAVKDRGNKIIIHRSAHKSVYNALSLCGIEPVIINTGVENSLERLITVKDFIGHLKSEEVIGALLTYPDYYGRTFDIKSVGAALKDSGKIFIADGAHGGHLKYSAADYAGDYADIFVDGLHKTFYTLNQGALVGCNRADLIEPLDRAVGFFSTTSPSYRILASVEYGEKYAYKFGREIIEKISARARRLKETLSRDGVRFVDTVDPFKICVDFGGTGICPYKAEKILEKENVFAEMNDGRHILFMLSFATREKDLTALESAIKKIKSDRSLENSYTPAVYSFALPKRVMPYLKAIAAEKEYVPVADAAGRIAAENAGRFPPCVPEIVAGERIDEKTAEFFSGRGSFFGMKDGKLPVVRINKQNKDARAKF